MHQSASEGFILHTAKEVRDIFATSTRARSMLGGIPHTENIAREIRNTMNLERNVLRPLRRRAFGFCAYNEARKVIGYISFTVIEGASPTQYERTYVWRGKSP